MGTLVNQQKQKKPVPKAKKSDEVRIDEEQISSKERRKIEKKLDKEYSKIRSQFEDVRQAFKYAEEATSREDLHFRLLQLEKTTKRVRSGGIFGRGAKTHRRLLRTLSKLPIE